MRPRWMLAVTGVLAAGLLLAAAAQDQDEGAANNGASDVESEPKAQTHTVERGDLVLKVERDGRLEAADSHKVRVVPEAYSGPLEFTQVARSGGIVEAGEVLFRFDDARLEEQLRQARESLADLHERMEHARAEQPIQIEANARRLEQAEKALVDAEAALSIWTQFQGPRMLRAAELSLQSSQNNVRNQQEELAQLEMMYQGTELASETKEIVIDRARRSLEITQGWLTLSKNDHTVTVEHNHPRQDRDTKDAVQHRRQELAHLRITNPISEARKVAEIRGLERSIRDGHERFMKLETDRERLVVRAPASGTMTAVEFEPGDTASARQVLTEIKSDSARALTFNATAGDLRVLRQNDELRIALPEYPELAVTGRIKEIGLIGQPSGEATHFPVTVEIQTAHPLLHIGLRCVAHADRTIEGVVLVPREAVTFESGRAYVNLHQGDDAEPEKREITVGASNDEHYQVVSGLEGGEVIRLPEKD